MRFFGDREREEDPREVVEEIAVVLAALDGEPRGPLRHGALAGALVRCGELAQGLADGAGSSSAPARSAMALTTEVARALWRSWQGGGDGAPRPSALATLRRRSVPRSVRTRTPEGYALYALYPEAYAIAARPLAGRDLTVVGIRSIGTSLAAMVAAGAGASRLPLTVRPSGHPFSRRVEDARRLTRAARSRPRTEIAIVDEGPGLSGSSLAAVAEALLEAGAAPERVHLFTSHPNAPGPRASPRTRELFRALPRHVATLDEALLAGGRLSLARLADDVIGPARVVEDLTGGLWRRRMLPDAREWPPSTGWLERRKFLLEGTGSRWLARFAGLGAHGEGKLARARALAEGGVGVAPAALRHGFLFERWQDGARPLSTTRVPRRALLDAVRRVVAVASARPGAGGAPPSELAAMARANAAEALGPEAAEMARRLEDLLGDVEREARPVEVDAKMQRWEWLVLPDGRLVKTDGLDHHAAHDLAGCQDALWDVAGAEFELGLSPREARALAEAARAVGPGAAPALLPFYRVCFLALEVGRWSFAAADAPDAAERGRREAALGRYRRGLAAALRALREVDRSGRTSRTPGAAGPLPSADPP